MRNPIEYCIDCGHRYGIADESCTNCGFDPIDEGEDEARQAAAESQYELWCRENPSAKPR